MSRKSMGVLNFSKINCKSESILSKLIKRFKCWNQPRICEKDYQENENNCEWKNRQNLVDKFGVKLKTFQFQIMQGKITPIISKYGTHSWQNKLLG